MSKKCKLNVNKQDAGCTAIPNQTIIEVKDLREHVMELEDHGSFLNRVIIGKDAQINQVINKSEALEKESQHMQTQMVMSLLQERTDLIARLMRLDQRLLVLGVTTPVGTPDAFTLTVKGLQPTNQ